VLCDKFDKKKSEWVNERLFSVIFEIREDKEGEFYHLVTLWKSTREG